MLTEDDDKMTSTMHINMNGLPPLGYDELSLQDVFDLLAHKTAFLP